MRRLLILAAAAFLPACGGAVARAEIPDRLEWRLDQAGDRGKAQLALGYRTAHRRSQYSRTVNLADLPGLEPARLAASASGPVHFRIARDAGRLDCQGEASNGQGSGDCRFTPDAAFAAELERRGIGTARPEQLFALTMSDTGRSLLDELARQNYARFNVADLVDAGDHGIAFDYLRDMGRHGYRVGSLAALVRVRDHGVDPAYVDAIVSAGLRDLPADTLVEMRDHGVSPDYIGELRGLGYSGLPVSRLIALRDHGISADYVRALAAQGIKGLPLDALVRLRDHGVDAHYVGSVRRAGFARFGTDEVVQLRDRGVSESYLRELGALGYADLGPDEIARLRDHGITGDFIRRASRNGRRSPDALIAMREGG